MKDGLKQAWSKIGATIRREAQGMQFSWRATIVASWFLFATLLPKYQDMSWYWDGLKGISHGLLKFCFSFDLGMVFILQFLIPLFVILLMGEKLRDYGLRLGRIRIGLLMFGALYLLSVPGFFWFLHDAEMQDFYQRSARSLRTWPGFFASSFALFVTMFRQEFLYRGFLLFGIKRVYGDYAGILAQLVPYVLLHQAKPDMELFASFIAGLFFGYLAIRTGSFFYGLLLHWSIAVTVNLIFSLS